MIAVKRGGPVDPEIIERSPARAIPGAKATLSECVERSAEVWQGFVDGRVACTWGLIPPTLLSETAWLWLLHTDLVEEHKFIFVRNSQRFIEGALDIYAEINGEVAIDNSTGIRWLRWLGAEFMQPYNGYIPFLIRKK